MSATMEQLLFQQDDLSGRISKTRSNYKKMSKDRKSNELIQSKLNALDQLWSQFIATHAELCRTADPKALGNSLYITKDIYDTTEELYIDYKCLLKRDLPEEQCASSELQKKLESNSQNKFGGNCYAKLPKIVIPKFSGVYTEWSTFRDLFQSLVHDTDMDKAIKMQYLKGLLGGEAEQLVRNMSVSSANYDQCWATLMERYNNKRFLCNTILKRLFSQRSSSVESAAFLKEILDNTTECIGALANLGVDVSNWDLIIIYMTSLKLDSETRKQWELQSANNTSDELPTFSGFKEFLTNRFRAFEFMGTGSNFNRTKVHQTKTFHVADEANVSVSCKYCSNNHKLVHCKKFEDEDVPARRLFIEKQRLCFNCLGEGHSANQCRCRLTCRICRRRHHTFLHLNGESDLKQVVSSGSLSANSPGEAAPIVCFASEEGAPCEQVLLATALVKVETEKREAHIVRALLDQGAQASFITEATAQHLGLKRLPVRGVISGVGGGQKAITKSMVKLTISSMREGFQNLKIPLEVYVLKSITTLLPSQKLITTDWVCRLPLADPEYNTPSRIDLLLGAEVVSQIMQEGIQKQGALLAQNTSFGWILSGVVESKSKQQATNLISIHQVCFEEDKQLKKFWELEADPKQKTKPLLTKEEIHCERFFSETTKRDEEGRYIVRLPFKTERKNLKIENSRIIAEKRLAYQEAKLNKTTDLKEKYEEVLEEYLNLGHMEKVPKEEIMKTEIAYLPHFAVVKNDRDTTKVRIVFDASCKGENGVSLNNLLMVGPTLQPELRNILMRWRLHPICLSSDIVKMYRQIKVAAEDIDFQRILWNKEKPDSSSYPVASCFQSPRKSEEFRLLRITFGTASAPYLAVKALQQVAIDEGHHYPEAAKKVKQDFYMDDLLTGCEDLESAIQLYTEMNTLLLKGGFELQKWSSNSEEFLQKVKGTGEENAQKNNLFIKEDDVTKLLGLTWDRKNDAFQYTVTLPQLKEPVTKRKVISDISRLFDPLGWVAPTVIVAKIIIQKLWLSGIEWDEIVPSNLLSEWLNYRNRLPDLATLQIPRWVHTSQKNILVELHGFSDASKLAYAAAVYLRVIDEKGNIQVNLVTAKTKVAPIKQVSIPRLELCGAVLAARLLVEVAEVLNIQKEHIHAWTDSTVVLAWLNSHPNRWQTFVANRVSEILTTLDSQQWSHIQSKHNPADCASRGVKPAELIENNLWFQGPEVLYQREINYDRRAEEETNLEQIKIHTVIQDDCLLQKFSSLGKLTRIVAYCRRFITYKKRKENNEKGFLTSQELKEALGVCIKKCQKENFMEEIANIEKIGNVNKAKLKGPLKSLNPFLDDEQILRVGGRLVMSSLSEERKHPILIPKKSTFTNLLIADAHSKTLHGGPQLMLTYLRSKFWIMGAKDLVRSYVRSCMKCIRYFAKPTTQLMGQLPAVRVTPSRPFKHSGVDYAGPIQVRSSKGRGHHAYKGYICLFVCMSTKAVHIEVVSDLTTEGFLAAFKRFVSRRGHCSDIWSDNGTGFVGASRQLPKMFSAELSSMQSEVAANLANNGTKWHFIPPLSPNFGGLWEAGVKSVKFHLKRVIGDSTLTYEELTTVLDQIEACLNSRPLSRADTESEGYEALTPGHFLVGEPLLTVSDYSYENSKMGSLRRWQLTQKMTQDFWRRWSQEYLTSLMHRYKWSFQSPEPKVGDLVLVKEDGLPPSRWLLGRVITKHPGQDNITRVVSLRTKFNVIKRPTSKLCVLPITV